MHAYLETMEQVLESAKLYPDRTGDGRWRDFGAMERYDLNEGLPLITTRQIFTENMVKELSAFIHGHTNVKELTESFWGRWAVKAEDIDAFVEQTIKEAMASGDPMFMKWMEEMKANHPDDYMEQMKTLFRGKMDRRLGEIGPMYGALWRGFPFPHGQIRRPWWFKGFADVPSDRIDCYREGFLREIALSNGEMVNDKETWESYVQTMYMSEGYDQLNALVKGLVDKPYSARHCLTAYHPCLNGPEDESPEFNVLNDYGALHPCHVFVQFAVLKNDQGRDCLHGLLYMRSSDVYIGRPYNIACYSLMTMILAHTLGYGLGDFVIMSGDTHLYNSHLDAVNKQLTRQPFKPTKVTINPDLKSIFDFKPSDIVLEGYQHHGRLDAPVAK